MSLQKYTTFFWDFDGVILDSNAVREFGFKKVLERFSEEQVNQLLSFHRLNGGLSRYVKFRFFYEEILGESVSEEQIKLLAEAFSEIMMQELTKPEYLIAETVDYIKEKAKKVPMYIVSGSDQAELRYLCQELGLASFFKGIYGSPIPKIQLVQTILEKNTTIVPSLSCLIGDSHNDWEAAQKNGLDFVGYNNEELIEKGNYYVNSFKNEHE